MLALALATDACIGASAPFLASSLFGASDVGYAFDFTDMAQMSQDNLGATPVTGAGQTIGRVLDISGKNNHAVQATIGNRPLYQGYASFDGTNDTMATGTITPTTDKATLITAVRMVGTSTHTVIAHGNGAAGQFDATFLAGPARMRGNLVRTNNAQVTVVADAADTANAVYTHSFDFAGATQGAQVQIRKNGVLVAQTVAGTGVAGAGNFSAGVGNIGSWAGSFFHNGRIYRAILNFRAMSAAEIVAAERWCGAAAGIAL